MNTIITVWLPVVAFAALTVTVIIIRTGSKEVAETLDLNLPAAYSEAVSTATDFTVIDGDSLKVTFGADIPVSIRLANIDAP